MANLPLDEQEIVRAFRAEIGKDRAQLKPHQKDRLRFLLEEYRCQRGGDKEDDQDVLVSRLCCGAFFSRPYWPSCP